MTKLTPYQWAGIVCLVVLGASIYKIPSIVVDAISLAVMAYLVTPVVRKLHYGVAIGGFNVPLIDLDVPHVFTVKVPKGLSIAFITLVIPLLLIFGLGAYLVVVVNSFEQLFQQFGGFSEESIQPFVDDLQARFAGTAFESVGVGVVVEWLANLPTLVGDFIVDNLRNILGFAPTIIHWGVFLIMLWIATIEWEKDVSPFIVEFVHLITPDSWENPIDRIFASMDRSLMDLLTGWIKVASVLAPIIMVVLLIAGFNITIAIFLGMLAGILSVVPFIGSWVALGVCLLVTFVTFQNESLFPYIVVAIGVGVVNFVLESKVLTPKFVGDSLRVWKIAVILAVLAGGKLFGVVGFVAALPILAVIKAFTVEGIAQVYFYKIKQNHMRGSKYFLPLLRRHFEAHKRLKREMRESKSQISEDDNGVLPTA